MKKVCLLAACVLALFSCQKEQNVPEGDGVVPKGYTKLTLKAVSDVTKTTLTLDEGGKTGTVKWAAKDKIKVICSDGPVAEPFEIVSGIGETSGSFAGYIPAGKTALHTVYPAASFSAVSGTTVKVVVPASQIGDFGSCNIAVANVAADHSMAFQNVNAFISFTVPDGVTKVVVSSVDESPLAGTLSVDCSGPDPAATTTYESTASSITAKLAGTAGTYYVSALPREEHEKGLLFEYYEGEEGETKTGTYWLNKKITTGVNNVYGMGEVSTSGDYYVTVDGGDEVKNGMSWATAWSASQFWSKIHPAGSDSAIDNAKLANINGATFHLAAGTYKWGADAAINIDDDDFGTVSFTIKGGYNASTGERDIENYATIFTGDDDADGTGDHRILLLDGKVNIEFNGITFTKGRTSGSEDNRFGGAVMIKAGSHSFVDCTFTQNSAETSGTNKGYGGAIRFDSNGVLKLTGTTFSNNTATGDSGALSLSAGTTEITDCSFSNNSAPLGGAIDCFGSSELSIGDSNFSYNTASSSAGGAVAMEDDATCSITATQFDHNSANTGGAISISGGGDLKIKRSYFYRNDAHTGGAVYTVKANEKYATVFVDECSFEKNWIRGHFGCIFNMNGFAKFGMYNSSAKDSYTKSTETDYLKGLNPSWIAVDPDGGEGCVSFGNCSIIGDTWDGNNNEALSDGTALIAIWGSKTNYFTNCIIVPDTASGIAAIKGNSGSEIIDLYYTHYSSVDEIGTYTNSGGNTANHTKSDFGSNYWSSGHCWKWNGKIKIDDSYIDTYSKATKKGVYDRINGICPAFVTWSDTDFVKDQLGNSRGANDGDYWWPGAYQN